MKTVDLTDNLEAIEQVENFILGLRERGMHFKIDNVACIIGKIDYGKVFEVSIYHNQLLVRTSIFEGIIYNGDFNSLYYGLYASFDVEMKQLIDYFQKEQKELPQ